MRSKVLEKSAEKKESHQLTDDIEEEILVPLAKNIVFVKYLSPDLLDFTLNFCKDCDFEDLNRLTKIAIKDPYHFQKTPPAQAPRILNRNLTTENNPTVPINFSEGTFGRNENQENPAYDSDIEGENPLQVFAKAEVTPTFGASSIIEANFQHGLKNEGGVPNSNQDFPKTFGPSKKILAIKPPINDAKVSGKTTSKA